MPDTYSIKHWTQNDYQSTVHLDDVASGSPGQELGERMVAVYVMSFLAPYLQVGPGGSVLGTFSWAAPPGGGSGPLRSFLSLLDPLTLFEVLSPNFCVHDPLHHTDGEPTSLAIVQPFTKHPP